MPQLKPFNLNGFSRKDEVILHRIRIGHTRLTQSYKFESRNQIQPDCPFCNSDLLSVKHVLLNCPHFQNHRSKFNHISSMKELFEKISYKHIIRFLKDTRLYDLI